MAIAGRPQTAEHIAKRVAAVAAARAAWTPEQKTAYAAKVREAINRRPEDVKRRFAKCNLGRPHVKKGKKWPDIAGANHGMYGKKHSDEAKTKMRAAKLGKKQPAALVQKRIQGRAGYRHTPEVKAKIKSTNRKTWSLPEVRSQVSGANSPAWQGGKSFEPYPTTWTKELRARIRERDRYVCRACGKPEDEQSEALCVHHIDYDKNNVSPSNLASVCKSCHSKTNSNRQEWLRFFASQSRRAS